MTVININTIIIVDVAPCSLVKMYRKFKEVLPLPWRWRPDSSC